MEGMDLKFTPVMRKSLLRHSSMFGPMAGTSGIHSQTVPTEGLTHLWLPTHPTPYNMPSVILQWF